MSYNVLNIKVGAGKVLHQNRADARTPITPKAATTPTDTSFICVTAQKELLSVGDILELASATPTNLASEAATKPVITSIAANGADWTITVSPAFSAAPAAGSATVVILYKNLGATKGDIVFSIKTTLSKQEIDQSLDIVAAIKQSREVSAKVPFAEATLRILALCTGEATPASATAMDITSTTPGAAREDRLLLIGAAPNGLRRFYALHRVVCETDAKDTMSKSNMAVFEGMFIAMPDTAMTPNVVSIVDVA